MDEFSDTFWTLPGDAVSTPAHWIQIDIDVDPAVLKGEDVLQLWQGVPNLRGGLIKQWTGKFIQPELITQENAQRASGDYVVEDHPDELDVGPAPEHHIRGAPHEHVELWASSATLRYHRNTTAANAPPATTPLFTARWSLSPRCPDDLEPDPAGGCKAPPTRLQNSPWLLAIIGVPGLLFIGFVLFMMAPHSWRTCPRVCCCLSHTGSCKDEEKTREARDAEGKQIEKDWADGKSRQETLVEMGRRHKASMRALARAGTGAAAAKKGGANKASSKHASSDPSPDAGAVHPDHDDASPSSLRPEPWVVLHGAPENFLTGAAAARAIRGTDGTAVTREPSDHSDQKRSAVDRHTRQSSKDDKHDANDGDGSSEKSTSSKEPWKILRGGPEPFLTGHAAAKAIRGTEGTNITREPSPSPPAPKEDNENNHRHDRHHHRDRSPESSDHGGRSSADLHRSSHRDHSPSSIHRHHPSEHVHDQHANLVRAEHHASHHPHRDADKDEPQHEHEHRHSRREDHHSGRQRDHDHDAHRFEQEADRNEHRDQDKKSHDKENGRGSKDHSDHDHHDDHHREEKSRKLTSAPSSSMCSIDLDGPHAAHQLQQRKIDKKAEADAHDPHLTPKDTAGDDVQHSNTTEHPAAEDGSLQSTVDKLSGIGPAEHEWSRRLKRELQRTIPIFFFELAGTSINWVFAVQYINAAARLPGGIIGDQLAMAYLSFGVLATIGAFINGWSRIVVIRELFCELYAAQHMPLSHSAYNSRNVAPGIEIAFLERHIHHLKVVGLTLLVESLPFAMLGFSKLYRFNQVQSNLLLLVSCGVSAFWVGSKLTRLVNIPELLSHIHRLEAEEREEAGARRAAQARRERKQRLPGAVVEQKLTAIVNAVLNIDEEAEDRERDAAWERKEKEAQQRLAEKHQQEQTHARAQGKHPSRSPHSAPSASPSPSPKHHSRSGSRSRSDGSNSVAVDVPGDGMVAKRVVAGGHSPHSRSRSRSRSKSPSRSEASASPRPNSSPSVDAQPHFHEESVH